MFICYNARINVQLFYVRYFRILLRWDFILGGSFNFFLFFSAMMRFWIAPAPSSPASVSDHVMTSQDYTKIEHVMTSQLKSCKISDSFNFFSIFVRFAFSYSVPLVHSSSFLDAVARCGRFQQRRWEFSKHWEYIGGENGHRFFSGIPALKNRLYFSSTAAKKPPIFFQ